MQLPSMIRLLTVITNLGTNFPHTEPRPISPKSSGSYSISVLLRVQVGTHRISESYGVSRLGVIDTMATGKTSAFTTAVLGWGLEEAVPTTGVILKWFLAQDRMFLA